MDSYSSKSDSTWREISENLHASSFQFLRHCYTGIHVIFATVLPEDISGALPVIKENVH